MDMKLNIFLLFFLVLSSSVYAFSGSGFEFDPYILSDCDELNNLSLNISGFYELGNNIDCSGYIWNNGNVPIGSNFGGVFDGKNYSIINFTHYGHNTLFGSSPSGDFLNVFWVNPKFGFNSTHDEINFFGRYPDAALFKNFHIVNGNLSCGCVYCTSEYWFADEFIGDSLIDGCSVSGVITGGGNMASFMYQSSNSLSINRSFSSVNIKVYDGGSGSNVAGLVGMRAGIQNSYFNGSIENVNMIPSNYWGGCCGRILGNTLKNNYVSAEFINISLGVNLGLFSGYCNGVFTDNHVDNETGGSNYRGSGCGVAGVELNDVSEMQSEATFTNWDFYSTWLIDEGDDFPKLKWQYPAPVIYGFSVENPDNDNFVLSNNSVFEYLAGSWRVTYDINSSSLISNNINNVSNVSNTIYFNESSYVHPVNIDSSLIEDANPHLFYVWMNDTFYNSSKLVYFSVDDSIIPNCSGLLGGSFPVNSSYGVNVSCIDESLNLFNLSCGGLYQFYNSSLDTDSFILVDNFILSNSIECFYNYCDKFDNCVSDSYIITAVPLEDEGGDSSRVSVDLSPLTEVMTKIFLLLFWVILLVLTLTIKGDKGNIIQFLNIMQMLVGFVAGSIWMHDYFLIGFPLIFVSLGFFIGLIMNGRG